LLCGHESFHKFYFINFFASPLFVRHLFIPFGDANCRRVISLGVCDGVVDFNRRLLAFAIALLAIDVTSGRIVRVTISDVAIAIALLALEHNFNFHLQALRQYVKPTALG
jgi:hypothetical protein